MKRPRTMVLAAAAVALLIVAVAASFGLGIIPIGRSPGSSTTGCQGCNPQVTVVDVIMPYIGTADNATNPDRVVNMTQGAVKAYEVDVYSTSPMSLVLSFNAFPVGTPSGEGGSGGLPTATFDPGTLTVAANAKGAASMAVTVPASAAKGVYDAVITATNASNSSQGWGLYFEVQVL